MISQTLEYALRAMVFLAGTPEKSWTAHRIAGEAMIPAPYLSKILLVLARVGLVSSKRGLGGGYVLALPPEDITILDIVSAVDPIRFIEHCPLGIPGHKEHLCPLHQRLNDAMKCMTNAFESTSLAEVVDSHPGEVAP